MTDTSLQRVSEAHARVKAELHRTIVGQEQVIDQLLLAILTRGHCLLVGVPGLAKTLLISSLAKSLDLSFNRIQFTPDLMPSDITGTDLLHVDAGTNERTFRFAPGPIFANVVLADEINRTPPKTQAALLESMVEGQVTVGGRRHPLPNPFFVLATQNPIEQEGTYPLPEAQLDRFMFMVHVDYPSREEELEILRRTTGSDSAEPRKVLGAPELIELQRIVRGVAVADSVYDYVLAITRGTRVGGADQLPFVRQWVTWGAGPRASQNVILGAKAHAALRGSSHVELEDVRAVLHPVMRHRIVTNFSASAEGITPDILIDRLLAEIDPKAQVGAGLPGVKA
ncbi:MAG: MoxR family ATPase [Planctomycetes bacterium]|nr:MoxR family ATPase [Planctomycetota bacterium]